MNRLSVRTFQLGLVGYPLGHSLSPKIHQAALDACGLSGNYCLFPVLPDDRQGLKELLARVRSGEIHGLNVTIPHKQNVIPLLDELTPSARAIGAVNTISLRDGKLTGDNTDVPGFLSDIKRFLDERKLHNPKPQFSNDHPKLALVFGAGGGARAVVYSLVNSGWIVTLASRRPEQAQTLITQFPNPDSRITNIEYGSAALQSLVSNLSLIVNTTPLGMAPSVDTSPWPDGLTFPSHAALYDLVYNPCETKFVKDARAAGLHAGTGLGMLIEQAALAFEIWTGRIPPRGILWNAVDHC